MKPDHVDIPACWSRSVRSGMLNVVSLAHWAITYSRSWCADSKIARAGLAVSTTSVGRFLKSTLPAPVESPPSGEQLADSAQPRIVTAKYPNHVWHVDLTVVPTGAGFWTAWFPFSLLQVWPFCFWIAFIIDHFSRRVVGFAVFEQQPTSLEVCSVMGRAIGRSRKAPRYIISDKGPQFWCADFKAWAKRRKISLRFGAVGKHGSIAIIERFIRSMKNECTRRLSVPMRIADMRAELTSYITWYNQYRPHQSLDGRTPQEVYSGSTQAPPEYSTRGTAAIKLDLVVSHHAGKTHLPLVRLCKAA